MSWRRHLQLIRQPSVEPHPPLLRWCGCWPHLGTSLEAVAVDVAGVRLRVENPPLVAKMATGVSKQVIAVESCRKWVQIKVKIMFFLGERRTYLQPHNDAY
jgi:hypothetical protein